MKINNYEYMRLLAIVLIVNSHLGALYPYSQMSFGGGLGNSLFYFLSGLALTYSQKDNPTGVISWLTKRFWKVIVPFSLMILFVDFYDMKLLADNYRNYFIITDVKQLNYFFQVLWILYLLFIPFFNMKLKTNIVTFFILIVIGIVTFTILTIRNNCFDETIYIKYPFNFINGLLVFLSGMIIAKNGKLRFQLSLPVLIVLFFIVLILINVIIKKVNVLLPLNIPLNLTCVYLLYAILSKMDLSKFKNYETIVKSLAYSSIAVYLVHAKILEILLTLNIKFPINIIYLYLWSFLIGYILNQFVTFVSQKITFLLKLNLPNK